MPKKTSKKKVLIVDDDPGICNSLAILFREEGYRVDDTKDSLRAAALINKYEYDVYIFDYKMKGLNGIDLLRMAKEKNRRCMVFIISGMLNINELCAKEIALGLVDGVMNKPFDVAALLRKIEAIK